jgi:hypothetical protein
MISAGLAWSCAFDVPLKMWEVVAIASKGREATRVRGSGQTPLRSSNTNALLIHSSLRGSDRSVWNKSV